MYLKFFLILPIFLTGIFFKANSMEYAKDWQNQDVQGSITRVTNVFRGQYTPNASLLKQEGTIVGTLNGKDKEVFITFRGSQGIEELWSSINRSLSPLREAGINLEGNGHAGYGCEFLPLRHTITSSLNHYQGKMGISLNELTLTIEGSSKGGALSTMTAAYLKGSELCKNSNISVLTYASANIFDDQGVESYNQQIGIRNHLNFLAEEDLIARYANVSDRPVGTLVAFPATSLEGYQQRVQNRAYTNMLPWVRNILNMPIISQLPSVESIPTHLLELKGWEAHVDPTYQEFANRMGDIKTFLS